MDQNDQQSEILSMTDILESEDATQLDQALHSAVEGIANSLREEEQERIAQQRRRQSMQKYAAVAGLMLIALALYLGVAGSPASSLTDQEAPSEVVAMKNEVTSFDIEVKPSLELGSPLLSPGNYTMHLPKGFEHEVRLIAMEDRHYRLISKKNLNSLGIYQLEGKRLVMKKPDDKRLTEFQWLITDTDFLELVAEPPAAKTGATYLGATLTRISD